MSALSATLLAILLGLSGCAAWSATSPTLTGHSWQLSETTAQTKPITLTFHGDGRLAGSSGCNRYFGRYQTGPGQQLSISELASTKMLCPGSQMQREHHYLGALHQVTRYRLQPQRLQLIYPGGRLDFTPNS